MTIDPAGGHRRAKHEKPLLGALLLFIAWLPGCGAGRGHVDLCSLQCSVFVGYSHRENLQDVPEGVTLGKDNEVAGDPGTGHYAGHLRAQRTVAFRPGGPCSVNWIMGQQMYRIRFEECSISSDGESGSRFIHFSRYVCFVHALTDADPSRERPEGMEIKRAGPGRFEIGKDSRVLVLRNMVNYPLVCAETLSTDAFVDVTIRFDSDSMGRS